VHGFLGEMHTYQKNFQHLFSTLMFKVQADEVAARLVISVWQLHSQDDRKFGAACTSWQTYAANENYA
jgi:hypothetical protein